MQLLIDDEKLRKEIGENAYGAVVNTWQWKDNKKLFNETIDKIVDL